ncbi:MAG: hypothetical protein PSV22_19365 [Pseudolabrys sp.]|nr:hypothetical protein [Pseudolabrys sp.]
MAYKPLFNSRKREALWQREQLAAYLAERGKLPICNLCDRPVSPDEPWDESHDPAQPRVFGGKSTGVAHHACNHRHGAEVVTPLVAHCNRVRQKHLGTWRSKFPLPGGRNDPRRRKVSGEIVSRKTGERWVPAR